MSLRKQAVTHIAGYMALLGIGWDQLLRKFNKGPLKSYSDEELAIILSYTQRTAVSRKLLRTNRGMA